MCVRFPAIEWLEKMLPKESGTVWVISRRNVSCRVKNSHFAHISSNALLLRVSRAHRVRSCGEMGWKACWYISQVGFNHRTIDRGHHGAAAHSTCEPGARWGHQELHDASLLTGIPHTLSIFNTNNCMKRKDCWLCLVRWGESVSQGHINTKSKLLKDTTIP